MMKFLSCITVLFLLVSGGAFASENTEELVVEVKFSSKISENMSAINALEKRREKYFRRFYSETVNSGFSKVVRSRLKHAEFAGERLIPVLDDFTFENIIRRTVQRDIREMDIATKPARVTVEVERMKLTNYSLVRFRSFSSVMTGTVRSFDAAGDELGTATLTWEFLPRYTQDVRYNGREYVFLDESIGVRVAPLATGFIEAALERLYPGNDAPGLIILSQ